MADDLTAERVREVLDYNPETGVFVWKQRTSNRVKVGDVAGGPTGQGYAHIGVDGRRHLAHRLAWLYVHGEWPSMAIDHKNGDGGDNRIANLRLATATQNAQNIRKATTGSTSPLLGVGWNEVRRGWVARIRVNGRTVQLGCFATDIEGHQAYVAAKRQFHEFCTI